MESSPDDNLTCDSPRPQLRRPNRQVDPVDVPARQLGAKRSALQAQRHRRSIAAWRAGLGRLAAGGKGHVIASSDGTLAFAVIRTSAGLLVERRHCLPAGPRISQMLVFQDCAGFDRWCAAEPVRFDDPQLHAQLCREGHDALDGRR